MLFLKLNLHHIQLMAKDSKIIGKAVDMLARKIARWTDGVDEHATRVPGLSLFSREETTEPMSGIYEPSVCLIAQGAKRVVLGTDSYTYDARHYLLTSLHLPTVFQITEASPNKPYLGLRLILNQRELSQLLADSEIPPPRNRKSDRGMAVSEVTLPLVSAFLRLIDLLDEPEDIRILSPIIQREITYRLLVGEQGSRLREIASAGSQSNQIARAIDWLKDHFAEPLRIDDLASQVRMSTSTFHHHFRAMTALSPLQFQKQLRLQEARRLMLSDRLDASSAAFEVGYESPSQFSREYKNLFGAPPMKDIKCLRESVAV